MNILEAVADRKLFGGLPAFRDLATWRPWLVFLCMVYGLLDELHALDPGLVLCKKHTGRTTPRPGGYPEAVAIVGCQSGKSQIAALVGVYEAAQAVLAGNRGVYVPLIAQDLRGAKRALLSYVREAIEASAVLRPELVRETADTLELSGQVSLGVWPCRPASVRGIRAVCAVLDELAFYITTEGRPTDQEMLRATRTRLATTGGKLLILSSPYAQAGALWDLHRRHHGVDNSPTLTWVASAPDMNPTLPQDYLERMAVEDPEAYRSEVLGEFRAGIAALLDPDALQDVVETGVRERAPESGRRYVAFADPAGGTGKDSFTVAIAHEDEGQAVLDVCRAWKPPFDPAAVIAEAAVLLKSYGLREVTADRYAGGFSAHGFASAGITKADSELDRSAIYLELLPAVNSRRVLILDDPELLRELRGLERRRGTSGRDRVDHRPGAHDDRANAAAGALVLALRPRAVAGMLNRWTGRPVTLADRFAGMRSGDPIGWDAEDRRNA